MSKRRRFSGKLLLLIVILAGLVALIPFVPISPLKASVEIKLSEILGRKVVIDSARISLLPKPHLILTELRANDDPVFGESVFLKAPKVLTTFDLVQYLSHRKIAIDSIVLEAPEISLVKNRNGVWNWTTLGKRNAPATASLGIFPLRICYSSVLTIPASGPFSASTIKEIKISSGVVRLKDYTEEGSPEVLYRNIGLDALLTPQTAMDAQLVTEAKGDLVFNSEDSGESDRLVAKLPFDLKIDGNSSTALAVTGSLGPGPIETNNITIGALSIEGSITSDQNTPISGNGRMSIDHLDIRSINLSERVARALKVQQIGDMNPGTVLTSLETDFQVSQGTVHTTGLKIEQLDGLGDATAKDGSFRIDSSLVVNYQAMVTLSPDATSQVKSLSPVMGLVVTLLETNNRVSVPIDITGDVRNPAVQVDVSRIF